MGSGFDIGKTYRGISEWLKNPRSRQRIFEKPRERISRFIESEDENPKLGGLAVDLRWLSIWYLNEGVAGILRGEDFAKERLAQAGLYSFWNVRVLFNRFRSGQERSMAQLNNAALTLAHLISMGMYSKAEELTKILHSGWSDGFFYRSNSALAPFMLSLTASWRNEHWESGEVKGYESILSGWRTEDVESLDEAFTEACDFHIARSRDSNDDEDFEFEQEPYRIYPIEILSVLRLRENLGLSIFNPTHPLMDTPLGILRPGLDAQPDVLLESFIHRLGFTE